MEDQNSLAEAQRHRDHLREQVARVVKLQNRDDVDFDEAAAEELTTELREWVLSVDRIVTYRVTLGTGGPAYGVDFNESGVTVWHQEWFQSKTHVEFGGYGDQLRDIWGIWDDDDQ
jgi:hypothetical protein